MGGSSPQVASTNVNPKEYEHYDGEGSPNYSCPERLSISMVHYQVLQVS